MEENTYNIKAAGDQGFLVLGFVDHKISNHFNKPFPPLSELIANYLCDDLNDIDQKNRAELINDQSDSEMVLIDLSYQKSQLKESLVYRFIGTMIENPDINLFNMDVNTLIQSDRAFRLSPGSPLIWHERAIVNQVKHLWSSEWVDHSLQEAASIEEMNEANFVSDEIVSQLVLIFEVMDLADRFTVDLLYHYFDKFSLSMIVFYVSGKIDETLLLEAYWVFHHGLSRKDWGEQELKAIQFLKDRLRHLKAVRENYES